MSDDDKIVRETLYQLLKAVLFPADKEFFDLVVQHYPLSFSMYADKVFFLFILTWEITCFLVYLKNVVFMHSLFNITRRYCRKISLICMTRKKVWVSG
ncbi:hypothetical protein Hanom_Chr02g00133761 [Helianthus anomalus]